MKVQTWAMFHIAVGVPDFSIRLLRCPLDVSLVLMAQDEAIISTSQATGCRKVSKKQGAKGTYLLFFKEDCLKLPQSFFHLFPIG